MPITFEEVAADIQREPSSDIGPAKPKQDTRVEELREQLARELGLMAERSARVCAD